MMQASASNNKHDQAELRVAINTNLADKKKMRALVKNVTVRVTFVLFESCNTL